MGFSLKGVNPLINIKHTTTARTFTAQFENAMVTMFLWWRDEKDLSTELFNISHFMEGK